MGAHTALADRTVRENIMTGIHFLGCKCCGAYDRHNEVRKWPFIAKVGFCRMPAFYLPVAGSRPPEMAL